MAGPERLRDAASAGGGQDDADQARRFIRKAFGHHLRRTPNLPNSIARSVAADIEILPLALPGESKPRNDSAGSPALLAQIAILAETLRDRLTIWHKLPDKLVHEVVTHGREGAIAVALVSPQIQASPDQAAALLQDLKLLTPTLLLRALCQGQLAFVTAGLARRAGVPLSEAERRLHSQGAEGLSSLYGAAQIPEELQRAFRAALQVLPLNDSAPCGNGAKNITGAIIAQLVKAYDEVCPEDLEHVLCQLTRRSLEQRAPLAPLRPALA